MNKNFNLNNETNPVIQTDRIPQRNGSIETIRDNSTPLFSESTEEETTLEAATEKDKGNIAKELSVAKEHFNPNSSTQKSMKESSKFDGWRNFDIDSTQTSITQKVISAGGRKADVTAGKKIVTRKQQQENVIDLSTESSQASKDTSVLESQTMEDTVSSATGDEWLKSNSGDSEETKSEK
ncbi:unnamed protein product [Litomosoides sigmodontis]|uniref:Uncharacterized protein n=1 Tax=Litomosoides sigmodontis TaxID=42156 RepID=A0A3P6TL75_LITSI|nr:unnamed protein product [Litomosoides sigmodontis]